MFDSETHMFELPELNTNILFPLFVSTDENEKGWIIVRERVGVKSTTNFLHCSNVEKLIEIIEFKSICLKGLWSHLEGLEYVDIGVLKKICILLNIDTNGSNNNPSELFEKLKNHDHGIPKEADISYLTKKFDNAPRGNLDDKFILNPTNNFYNLKVPQLSSNDLELLKVHQLSSNYLELLKVHQLSSNEVKHYAGQASSVFVEVPGVVNVPQNMRQPPVKLNQMAANNIFSSVAWSFVVELAQCVWLYRKDKEGKNKKK